MVGESKLVALGRGDCLLYVSVQRARLFSHGRKCGLTHAHIRVCSVEEPYYKNAPISTFLLHFVPLSFDYIMDIFIGRLASVVRQIVGSTTVAKPVQHAHLVWV